MGGLSLTHILIFAVIILILFGPSRLPGLGKSLGEAIRGFKKGISDNEIDVTHRNEQIRDGDHSHTSSQKSENKEKV